MFVLKGAGSIKHLLPLVFIGITNLTAVKAQSSLLESVKGNPQEAIELCEEFKALNKKGISASSNIAINDVARKRNLSRIDAEILSTYVIGLNCPDVR